MITYRFMVDAAHVDINLHTYVDAYLSSEYVVGDLMTSRLIWCSYGSTAAKIFDLRALWIILRRCIDTS